MSHEGIFELSERIDAFRLKSEISGSSSFSKNHRKVDAQEDVGCPLNRHESLVALKVVDRIGGAVVWLHLWHLELRWNRLVQDVLGKRLCGMKVVVIERLLTFHLKLSKSAIDFLKLAFVVVESPLLGNSEGGSSR